MSQFHIKGGKTIHVKATPQRKKISPHGWKEQPKNDRIQVATMIDGPGGYLIKEPKMTCQRKKK